MFSAATKTGSQPASAANWIDDVFSTYLYSGNGSTQTITNGIDLAGKGGMVWIKARSYTGWHNFTDTNRGPTQNLYSNSTSAQVTATAGQDFASFNTNGFSLGVPSVTDTNFTPATYCSWTFREQAKFFDVVTWSGNSTNRTISHNLGSVPGMIIVKRTDTTGAWQVYHRSLANTEYLVLNTTAAKATGATRWNSTTPTSTEFSLGTDATVNASGGTYVAYLFAHDAGGFGAAGTDNVISCGSFTGPATVTLGWEPQYILFKRTDGAQQWYVMDNMRGIGASGDYAFLSPNVSDAEGSSTGGPTINATGFTWPYAGASYIYMAIRRPMKPPTSGTQVFSPLTSSATLGTKLTTGFPIDLQLIAYRDLAANKVAVDRLRGISSTTSSSVPALNTNLTNSESFQSFSRLWDNTGFTIAAGYFGENMAFLNFRRAPGFFDVVCWSGTDAVGRLITHNLTTVPELIIAKVRSEGGNWAVWQTSFGLGNSLRLNATGVGFDTEYFSGTVAPTSTQFKLNDVEPFYINRSGQTYVAYLFATLAGVSKVGSYTGNGGTQAIACGFTGGARFVMIKRTDSTGGWYVYDTARGMTLLTDPYLLLNSTAAEAATLGSVTTTAGGFTVDATILAAINTNAASYIFLAIS